MAVASSEDVEETASISAGCSISKNGKTSPSKLSCVSTANTAGGPERFSVWATLFCAAIIHKETKINLITPLKTLLNLSVHLKLPKKLFQHSQI